jgi:hypothetical protein
MGPLKRRVSVLKLTAGSKEASCSLPLDNLLVELHQSLLYFGDVDILPPGFLPLSRGLACLARALG